MYLEDYFGGLGVDGGGTKGFTSIYEIYWVGGVDIAMYYT